MILIDAGPLIALLDASDAWHQRVTMKFRTLREPLLSTWPAITEAFYVLQDIAGALDRLWDLVERAPIEVDPLSTVLAPRMRELMAKYADLPMDLADASLIAVAEQRRISRILTTDERDFSLYRPKHRKRLLLV